MNQDIQDFVKRDLNLAFFQDKAFHVAPELLGKLLIISDGSNIQFHYITEVEAYDGFDDKASHAYSGITERNKVMFGPGGFFYIYLCYGIHWMLNIVTAEKDYPSAILIRSTDRIKGPGRITKILQINREKFNAHPAERRSGMWFAEPEIKYKQVNIKRSPRIGVDYAGKEWKNKKWRFYL